MAKRKPAKVPPRPSPAPAPNKSEEKIATLRRYYELGWRASDTTPDRAGKKPELLESLAAEAGVKSGDTIRKALLFARTYNRAELEELIALRDPDGEPLGWYLVRVLLQVKDKARREDLQKRAAAEGWSREDLWDEIGARQGGLRRVPRGGRKFAIPRNPQQALRRLVERCESWLRFYEGVGGEGGLAVQVRTASKSAVDARGLKELVRQARTRLREVEEASRKVADQLQKLERKLKTAGPDVAGSVKAEKVKKE